jgi:sec-independent protein translocase protein TatA
MFGMGHWEILIILLVILLIFGAKRIPEMAQGLGKGIREFRTAMRDVQEEIDVNAPPAPRQNIEPTPAAQSVAQNAPANTAQNAPASTAQGEGKSPDAQSAEKQV